MKPSYSLKNRSTAFVLLLAVFMTVTQVLTASAQGGEEYLKGSCKDEKGAPMIGVSTANAVVERAAPKAAASRETESLRIMRVSL